MLCLIASVKHRPNTGNLYYIANVDGPPRVYEVKSNIVLKPGEFADIEMSSGVVESAAILGDAEAMEYSGRFNERLEKHINSLVKREPYRKGIDGLDLVTDKLWDRLADASSLLLKKILLGTPIIIRFHNDADGGSGAYSIYKAINELSAMLGLGYSGNISWIMQPGVSYSMYDAASDLLIANSYSSVEKPLLMIVDFGTSPDSNKGIETLSSRFDIIWLDHHPVIEGFAGKALRFYVNPWLSGGDSNYTAGFLASAFSRSFSYVDTEPMEHASFIGDYSEFATASKRGLEMATILDLLTSDTKIGSGSFKNSLTPAEIDNILKDKVRTGELLSYANSRLNEVLDAGLTSVKKHVTANGDVYVLNFERIRSEESKYPLPGRYASKLLGRIRELYGKKSIVVVHAGSYISVRLDKELSGKADILAIISSIKERYPNLVDAGGGHKCAASIKLTDKADRNTVLRELVSLLKSSLS